MLLFLLSTVQLLRAQSYDIDFITSSDGLSNSSVIKVFQDSDGVMWFGTWDGLNSWNSRFFRIWKSQTDDPSTLSSNVVRDIAEDKDGYLWVTTDRGVDRFDRKTGIFKRFFSGGGAAIKGEQPFSIFAGDDGLFVFLDNDGIWRYEADHFIKIFDSSLTCRKFRMDGIVPVILDKQDNLYRSNFAIDYDPDLSPFIGCNDCLIDGDMVYTARNDGLFYNGQPILEGIPVLSVVQGTQGVIWAGTDMRGVARINPGGPMFSTVKDKFGGSAVRCFQKNEEGRLLVGTKGSGIYLLSSDGAVIRRTTTANGLLSNAVYCMASAGNRIWVGTEGSGLNYLDRDGGAVSHLVIPDSLAGFSPASVYSILPVGRDTLWVGTSGHGLIRITLSCILW